MTSILKYILFRHLIVCSLLSFTLQCAYGQLKTSIQGSGLPLKVGSADRIGGFALESIAMYNMGVATVDDDIYDDLFLSSDSWHPGTYLYYFRGFTAK